MYRTQKIPYWYYRDKYAVQLLEYHLQEEVKMSDLKASTYQSFLQKAPLKEITSRLTGNRLSPKNLSTYLPKEWLNFNLTFSKWGGYKKHTKDRDNQTTRQGFSFVIQLNFGALHDVQYHRLISPKNVGDHPFKYTCHPVAVAKSRLTLGWARIDLDLDSGELLIEEIQNDWLREVDSMVKRLTDLEKKNENRFKNHWFFYSYNTTLDQLKKYQTYLAPYKKIWAEAILAASIEFSVKEMGIRDIYFHTYESGCKLKDCTPPKSIYTKLPKRLGFQKTNLAPQFIRDCTYLKKTLRKNDFWWWKLAV